MWLYTAKNCDQFFNASVCHVCKTFGKGAELKTCSGCKLIHYCCIDHQKIHWHKHKPVCQAVQEAYSSDGCAAKLSAASGQKEKMRVLQQEVSSIVERDWRRKLQRHEIQMFKYARMCRFCGGVDDLQDCRECFSVIFCKTHAEKHNEAACRKYEIAFRSEMLFSMNINGPHWRLITDLDSVMSHGNMAAHLCAQSKDIQRKGETDRAMWEMEQSTHFTNVLSIYQGLKTLEYDGNGKTLIIHVVGASERELRIMHPFEVLLHLYPSLQHIDIVLIGPELPSYKQSMSMPTCLNCMRRAKNIIIQYQNMVYTEYVEHEMRGKADFIVGFNCRFHEHEIGTENETWAPSIKVMAEQNVPVILTCHSKYEAKLQAKRINSVLGKEISYCHCEENPFAGLRLFREYEFEFEENSDTEEFSELDYYPVYSDNQYILIYKTLRQ